MLDVAIAETVGMLISKGVKPRYNKSELKNSARFEGYRHEENLDRLQQIDEVEDDIFGSPGQPRQSLGG